MSENLLLFWTAGPHLRLSPPEIARELLWGEEIEGLIDLPIKEILDRLKVSFPNHVEKAGLLLCNGQTGSFEATWTWQHLRVDCRGLSQEDRDRLIDAIESFGCEAYQA